MLPVLASLVLAATPMAPSNDFTPTVKDLLGIPYVHDGALDEHGRWTFFAHPDKLASGPGLNCSGLVVAAARRLLARTVPLADATRDRLGDSGPDSPLGQDWDFGWDLVMNLSEGLPRRALLPDGPRALEGETGGTLLGFSITDARAWAKVLPRLRTDRVVLATLSRMGKHLEHHHVAFVLRDAGGRIWFYQTMPKGLSHRIEISSAAGFERLGHMFESRIRVLLVEVEPRPAAVRAIAGPARRDPRSTGTRPSPDGAPSSAALPNARGWEPESAPPGAEGIR